MIPAAAPAGVSKRDAERSATLFDVVEVETEVGGDRSDELADARQHGNLGVHTHRSSFHDS